MLRSILLLAAAATALVGVACAPHAGLDLEPPTTRPVPGPAELSKWLAEKSRADSGRPAFFIQMADPQLGMSGSPLWLALFGATWNDDDYQADARLFATAIDHANELAPAFVVICGDLVHRAGHSGQIAEFQRIAAKLSRSIPLYFVAGNHDVGNKPTAESLHAYRETFGSDWYSFRNGSVYGIVLNSQLIDAPESVPDEAEQQLAWLRRELAHAQASGARHVLVFQHQSLFLVDPDEGNRYFNIDREARALYLGLFEKAGVEAIFAGHYHRNARGRSGKLEMVTSGPVGRPLGDDPSGLRIVRTGQGALKHEYFALRTRRADAAR